MAPLHGREEEDGDRLVDVPLPSDAKYMTSFRAHQVIEDISFKKENIFPANGFPPPDIFFICRTMHFVCPCILSL